MSRWKIGPREGSKEELFKSLLKKGSVMLHVDATKPGSELPEEAEGDVDYRLSLRRGLEGFRIGKDGVRAKVILGGEKVPCNVPFKSIWAMQSHRTPLHYIWPEDAPKKEDTRE